MSDDFRGAGNMVAAWYQNRRPWLTMKWPWTAIMLSVALHTCFSEPTTKIWMKIDQYYQRQKCSPRILVSSKISLLCGYLFNIKIVHWVQTKHNKKRKKCKKTPIKPHKKGVRWRGGVKWFWEWEWGGRKWRFSLLSLTIIFWTLIFKATFIILCYEAP